MNRASIGTQLVLLVTVIATGCPPSFFYGEKDCLEIHKRCPDGKCHECCDQEDCDESICCDDFKCHECCDDDNCYGEEICNEDFKCCIPQGKSCACGVFGSCCPGLSCDVFTLTCTPACTYDSDCQTLEVPFADDLQCDWRVCDFDHCAGDYQCHRDRLCLNGDCVTPPVNVQATCEVIPATAVTRPGVTTRLSAAAYLPDGYPFPGSTFTWVSNDDTIAGVDGIGRVTGGPVAGTATITVEVDGPNIACQATTINYGAPDAGHTRILVVDEQTGAPLEGATVVMGTEPPGTTGTDGTAQFTVELSTVNPAAVTVSKEDYEYVTLLAVESTDVIVNLDALADPLKAGGVKGKLTFDKMPCEYHRGLFRDATVGVSIPSKLVNLNPDMLVGDPVKVQIEIGNEVYDGVAPTGSVGGMHGTWFKEVFTPRGAAGNRIIWGIGAISDFAQLGFIPLPVKILSDEFRMTHRRMILNTVSFYTHTAVVPNVEVLPIPMVTDTEDINDNQIYDELVPDYDNFQSLPGGDLALKVPMDKYMGLTLSKLPIGTYDAVLAIAGVFMKSAGFVPLGGAGNVESYSEYDPPDGIISPPIRFGVSEVAGRLPESRLRRAMLSMAFNTEDLKAHAVNITFVENLEGTVSVPPFPTPADVEYDPAARRLTVNQLPPGADVMLAMFTNDEGAAWNTYGPATTGTFDLPPPPPEGDRAARLSFISIDLTDLVTYQYLPAFNNTNLGNLIELVESFSFTEVP